MLHLCQDLQALGYQVDVLAPHAPGAARREDLEGVRVERFRYSYPEASQTVCYQGGALINLRKRPVERLKLPALVAAEWAATQIRLRRTRYDLMHSHWVLPQGFVGMLASSLSRVPHVITLHGGDLFGLRGPVLARLKRMSLMSADAVTVNSSFTEARVRELAPRLEKVERIPMGVDDSRLGEEELALAARVRAEQRRGAGPLLVFAGRLIDEKGPFDTVEALAVLRRDFPDARLIVMGEGQDRAALEARVARLNLGEHVSLLGWVPTGQVRGYLRSADVFVGPSKTAPSGWVEAQGLTFLEAMAAGVPVVATRSGGIVDTVKDEETGLLVDESSPQQIARAVTRLLREPRLADELVAGGHRILEGGFSRAHSAQGFADLFERCMR